MAGDPLLRLHERVDQLLHGRLVAVHPGGLHVQAGGRVRAAERGLGTLRGPHVHQRLGLTAAEQRGDGGLGGHPAVDLLVLHGRDERRAGLHRDRRDVARRQSTVDGQVLGEEVGRRAQAGDPEPAALPVGRGPDDAGQVGAAQLDLTRRLLQLDDRLGLLALALQVDGVVVEADHAVDLSGEHGGFRVDAGRLVGQLDVQPLRGEVAELLGVSAQSVYSARHRVMQVLREQMAELATEGE